MSLGGQVDHRKASTPEADASLRVGPGAAVVGTSMDERVRHRSYKRRQLVVASSPSRVEKTSESAHGWSISQTRTSAFLRGQVEFRRVRELGEDPVHFDRAITGSLDPHLFLHRWPPCSGKLRCDLREFAIPEFTEPLRFALVGLGIGIVVCLAWRHLRRRRRHGRAPRPIAIVGLLFAGAALAGYQRTGHLVVGLAVAVVLLAGGGLISDLAKLPLVPRMLLAVPGAILLAERSALPDPGWVRVFVAFVTVVGAGLVADLDRRNAQSGLGPVLLAVTMFGLWESVPDPDFALLLVGAALPLALLGWPVPLARVGSSGSAAASGLLAWAAAVGGRGLLSAVVAGSACLGLFVIEPVAHLLLRRRQSVLERLPPRLWVPVLVGLVQLGVDAACTRIAAWGRSPLEAGEIAAASLVAAIGLACALSTRAAPRSVADGPRVVAQRASRSPGPPVSSDANAS